MFGLYYLNFNFVDVGVFFYGILPQLLYLYLLIYLTYFILICNSLLFLFIYIYSFKFYLFIVFYYWIIINITIAFHKTNHEIKDKNRNFFEKHLRILPFNIVWKCALINLVNVTKRKCK